MAIVTVDDKNFEKEVLQESIPVLVDFYADWCGPCQALAPILEEIASETEGKAKICKLNVDIAPERAKEYKVMSIPALKIFKGGEVVEEMTGLQSKETLVSKLEAHA
ncbi:MAG TPA: thioredoxin [Candidatus Peregrinibacteria bacterium]|nr:thioredoxin [Candidatus Peregrinibacteria bacterium]